MTKCNGITLRKFSKFAAKIVKNTAKNEILNRLLEIKHQQHHDNLEQNS